MRKNHENNIAPVTPSQAYFSVPYKTRGWITGNIACAPDGRYLAAASRLGIWLYDTETDEEVRLFTGHQDTVTDVAFSPDGNSLVSAVEAGTIRLWDVNTGEQKHIFTPTIGSLARIAFSPAGNALAVTLSNRTLISQKNWRHTMARQPKVDLGSILQPKHTNRSPIPETAPEPTPEPPVSQKRSYPSREGKVPVQFFLNKDAHRQLKIVAAETDKSHQDILIEALNAWFLINDKPPIA